VTEGNPAVNEAGDTAAHRGVRMFDFTEPIAHYSLLLSLRWSRKAWVSGRPNVVRDRPSLVAGSHALHERGSSRRLNWRQQRELPDKPSACPSHGAGAV